MTVEEGYAFDLRWSNRPEAVEQCADRLAQTIEGLRPIDPLFGQWKKQAYTFEEAHVSFCTVPADRQELIRIFESHKAFYDVPPDKPWPEMGYSVAAWNGMGEDFSLAFRVDCGAYDSHLMRPNSFTLDVSHCRMRTGAPWQGSELREILPLLIAAWEPDEAIVACNRNWRGRPPEITGKPIPLPPLPSPGWLTYLSAQQLLKITPPTGVRVDRLSQGGAIFTVCEEPFMVGNPRHIELIEALDRAMRPVQRFR
jgi:hypothetical protein